MTQKQTSSSFKKYQIPTGDLIQYKFQPLTNRHWLFCMEGLDCFFVKKVERPPYIRGSKDKTLVVYLWEAIAPSTRQQVQSLVDMEIATYKAEIKILDCVGTCIGLTTYTGVHIERVDWSTLDYDSSDNSIIKMTLSYTREKLEY